MKIEGTNEFFTVVGVQANWHFVDYFGYDDEGPVEEHHDIVIFLFVAIFFHFEADGVVESDDLVSKTESLFHTASR